MKKNLLLLIGAAALLAGCGEVVDAGNRGVSVSSGKVDPKSYPEGFYWYNPFTTTINEISAKNRSFNSEVQSTTRDLQIVTLKFNLNFRPDPNAIPKLFQTRGDNWEQQIVAPAVVSLLKGSLAGYRAPDVVANQQRIQFQVADQIRRRLLPLGVIVETFDIQNISFSEDYAKAIEAKEVAIQRAQAAKNQTEVIREEGNQKVIAAQADAQAIRAKSEAISASPKIVAYEWVKAWNGEMPNTVYCSASTPCVGAPQ